LPKYFYVARTRAGQKDSGVEEAPNQDEALSRLQSRDLLVITIVPESKEAIVSPDAQGLSKSGFKFKSKHTRISGDDLVLFCRQVATLLGAGVTILKTLSIISQQVSSRKLQDVIEALQKDMEVVGEAVDGQDAIEKVLRLSPDVALMDIVMPNLSGIEATKRLSKDCPQTKVLILTQYDEEENMIVAKQSGAFGFIPKKAASSDLITGVRFVNQGKYFPPSFAEIVIK